MTDYEAKQRITENPGLFTGIADLTVSQRPILKLKTKRIWSREISVQISRWGNCLPISPKFSVLTESSMFHRYSTVSMARSSLLKCVIIWKGGLPLVSLRNSKQFSHHAAWLLPIQDFGYSLTAHFLTIPVPAFLLLNSGGQGRNRTCDISKSRIYRIAGCFANRCKTL